MITAWSKQLGGASALTSSFGYDAADQLTAASVPSASATTNYADGHDLAANRTREQIDTGVTGSTFNSLNQLTAQSAGGPMEFTGTVNEWATVTLAGRPATVDASGNWRGTASVAPGANAVPLVATDASGNATTRTINIAAILKLQPEGIADAPASFRKFTIPASSDHLEIAVHDLLAGLNAGSGNVTVSVVGSGDDYRAGAKRSVVARTPFQDHDR